MSNILITGGNSYLGRCAIDRLLSATAHDVTALVSLRDRGGSRSEKGGRLRTIPADLLRPLLPDVAGALAASDQVWHFAWIRGSDVVSVDRANMTAIEQLMRGMSDPARFYFVSSVGASPRAHSVYGRTKWRASTRVRAAGGVSLVVGLVADAVPQGPYKLLCDVVQRTPVALRLSGGPAPVFSVWQDELMEALLGIADSPLAPGSYRLFTDQPNDFNEVMLHLEARAVRARLPVRVPRAFVLSTVAGMRRLRLAPAGLADKVLGFLFKDEALAATYRSVPGTSFRNLSSEIHARGAPGAGSRSVRTDAPSGLT